MSKPRRAHYETNHQTSRALSVYGDGYRCGSRVLHTTYRRARCFIVRIYIYRWNWCCPTDADLPVAPRELCMDMYSFVISQIIDLFRISCGASIRSSQLNVPHHSRAYLESHPTNWLLSSFPVWRRAAVPIQCCVPDMRGNEVCVLVFRIIYEV